MDWFLNIIHALPIISGILSLSAYSIYIFSIFKGKTKPSRSTWWILTLVGLLIFLTSRSIGARESEWIQLSYIIGPFITAILSLFPRYGYKSGLLLVDKICLFGAMICIFIWIFFDSPLIAFLGSIVVDFIGLIPTIKKAYIDPEEEYPIAWFLEMIAILINAVGINFWFSFSDLNWIYASYLVLSNGLILILLKFRTINKFFSLLFYF